MSPNGSDSTGTNADSVDSWAYLSQGTGKIKRNRSPKYIWNLDDSLNKKVPTLLDSKLGDHIRAKAQSFLEQRHESWQLWV